MAGRFPLFTDACVNGHLVDALIQNGWDLVRAIDLYPERTPDPGVFARAAREGRVFVSNDGPIERLARAWIADGRSFRMVFWPQQDYRVRHILRRRFLIELHSLGVLEMRKAFAPAAMEECLWAAGRRWVRQAVEGEPGVRR